MRIVDGTIVSIDRQKKVLQLSNNTSLSYDFLVLTDGAQAVSYSKIVKEHGTVVGVFHLKTEKHATAIKQHLLQAEKLYNETRAVVYGNS